jgi:threonine synthase
MMYQSTRGGDRNTTLSAAIVRGLAGDGGLFVPQSMPGLDMSDFAGQSSLADVGTTLLEPFAREDELAPALAGLLRDVLDFPAPLVPLERTPGPASVLELFHGPTCAFKDFGARFLAAALERIGGADVRPLTILVATSGDTGGAVAAAFHRRSWANVYVLYPRGLVSERQAHHLACWGDNVRTFSVDGTFDDCQRLVKAAFADPELSRRLRLSSANSINIGRLLPQMIYYASASLEVLRMHGTRANFIVPAGNLGNVLACVWARMAGLPIGDVVLATNANRTVVDFLHDGVWRPRASVATLASAMDVGNPSNMERLRWSCPQLTSLQTAVRAVSVTDEAIRRTIAEDYHRYGRVWCPHSATAAYVYRGVSAARQAQPWVLVATAHPAKFNDIVEPLIGATVPVPPPLARLLERPRQEHTLAPELDALRRALRQGN